MVADIPLMFLFKADFKSFVRYPDKLRRIKYHDLETGKRLTFLTNHFELEAQTAADL